MPVKICCLNVRGIRDNRKRRKVFSYLKEQGGDIFLLQETHGCAKTNHLWTNEWGAKGYYSNGTTNSGGVCTLVKNKSHQIHEVVHDMQGQYIICKVKIKEDYYSIVNIYAPAAKDSPEFFNDVFSKINQMRCDFWIIGGDFNVTLNQQN